MANGALTLMHVALEHGELPEAFARANEAMRLRRELGDRFGQAWVLDEMAAVHLAADDPAAAITALSESRAVFVELNPAQAARQAARVEELRERLGPGRG